MDPASQVTRTTRAGFSLAEVLVALALVGLVMSLAWMMLSSTRQVAAELSVDSSPRTALVWETLSGEIDRLVRDPLPDSGPVLTYSPEDGLAMVSLIPDEFNVYRARVIRYQWVDADLLRIESLPETPLQTETNVVLDRVKAFRTVALTDQGSAERWPPSEGEKGVPPQLRVSIETEQEGEEVHTWFLPISIRADPPSGIEPEEP